MSRLWSGLNGMLQWESSRAQFAQKTWRLGWESGWETNTDTSECILHTKCSATRIACFIPFHSDMEVTQERKMRYREGKCIS